MTSTEVPAATYIAALEEECVALLRRAVQLSALVKELQSENAALREAVNAGHTDDR